MPRKASPHLHAIRLRLRAGESVKDIAKRLGVTPGYVYAVRARLPERQTPVGIAALPVSLPLPVPPPPPLPVPKQGWWDRLLSFFRG